MVDRNSSNWVEGDESVRLFVQFFVGLTALLLAFEGGFLGGALEPWVRISGTFDVLLPALAFLLCLVFFVVTVVAPGLSSWSRSGAPSSSLWDRVTGPALVGAAVGAVVGGGLVYGVPDWVSSVLPLVALSLAAVAFGIAGTAVPVRGLDSTLSVAAGTLCLFVVPFWLSVPIGGGGYLLGAGLAPPILVASRRVLQTTVPTNSAVAVVLAVVLAVLGGAVMAYDLSGPRPTVSLDADETVDLSMAENRTYTRSDYGYDRPTVRVGTVTVRNDFGFARTATLSGYDACIYAANGSLFGRVGVARFDDGSSWVSDFEEQRIPGRSERQLGVVVTLDDLAGNSLADARELGRVPTRRAERCPESTDGKAMVVVPQRGE